jgi:2',3'-cyclic-nucleotide 2'-phosphodiesterase
MLKILFIGDISGKIGRQAIAGILPKLKKELKINLVIANAENAAHGSGITEDAIKELQSYGIDYFTSGDHAFKRTGQFDVYDEYPVIRPANYAKDVPGQGYALINNGQVLLINLIGRVFMHGAHDCPFYKLDEILARIDLQSKKLSAIIIDMHAEATSEKVAMRHYADGRVTAVLGTHTHIQTADAKISDKGTAYLTDTGMVGASDSCLGVDKEGIIKTFLSQIKYPHQIPIKGQAIFNSVLITVNPKNRQATSIKPITKFINI